MITGLTVVDDLSTEPSNPSIHHQSEQDKGLLGGGDLETVVLRIVKDDPFATISEIKQAVRDSTRLDKVGWWRVFSLLRRRGLLTRRARFRFARGRR